MIKVLLITLLLAPIQLLDQGSKPDLKAEAKQELESIILEAGKIDDKNASVLIRARAIALITDPTRVNAMFLELWNYINTQSDPSFDKQQARAVTLRFMFERSPKLAKKLLGDESFDEKLGPKVAVQLLDSDPATAASLIAKSMPTATNPIAAIGALNQLRQRDTLLADYVATQMIDQVVNQPTIRSLPGMTLMAAYIFPGPDTAPSPDELQLKYFSSGYEVLKTSLTETNESLVKDHHYAPKDLQFRGVFQSQLASLLAAMAPRIEPSLQEELNSVAAKLNAQSPANVSQMTAPALARISGKELTTNDPELKLAFEISKGNFDEAEKDLDLIKDDEKHQIYAQLLIKSQVKSLLSKGGVMDAVILIRKLEDPVRLVMYLEAIKATKKKPELGNLIINEAELLIPQVDRNALHVQALLLFSIRATDDNEAAEFLNSAVTSINALTQNTPAPVELNDPKSLLNVPEFQQAFARSPNSGQLARRINLKSLQLFARLSGIEKTLKEK